MSASFTLIRFKPLLLVLAALPGWGELPHQVVGNAVADRFRPAGFFDQRLTGVLGERMRAAREGYLERADQALLAAFRDQSGVESKATEQLGRFLEAAAIAYDYSHDPNLKTVMDRAGRELESAHRAADLHGYRGELLGLFAYYRITGDKAALAESKRIADLVVDQLSKSIPVQDQMAPTFIEPLVNVYRYTGYPRYLEFSKRAAGSLLQSASRTPLAYRNDALPALSGLVELYRLTGNETYLARVVSVWPTLRDSPFFLSVKARFLHAGDLPQLADPCATCLWIQLTASLLRLTGQAQYGQELEHIIYNQLFAAQDPRTGNVFAAIPLNGSKKAGSSTAACAPDEALAIAMIPSAVWGRDARGIVVVLYTPGRATVRLRRRGAVQLYSESAYPESGEILLHVEPDRNLRFPLRLRVPEWTSSFIAESGKTRIAGKPGTFLTITREWRRGDTVKISIDMTAHVIEGPPSSGVIAIARGPQVLALGKTLNPHIADISAPVSASINFARLKLTSLDTKLPATWAGNQAYSVPGEYNGKPGDLVLVPFAEETDYRVWIQKPGRTAGK